MTSYPPQPGPSSWPPPAGDAFGGGGLPGTAAAAERNWAMFAHLGSFLAAYVALGLFAPLIVLLVKGNDSPYIRRHAVESLNFQITTLIVAIVGFALIFVLIGFVVLAVWGVVYLICVVLAGIRASDGEEYRYPVSIRLVS